jgi:hypothetical protein
MKYKVQVRGFTQDGYEVRLDTAELESKDVSSQDTTDGETIITPGVPVATAVSGAVAAIKTADLKPYPFDEPRVTAAQEVFGGEVRSVRPTGTAKVDSDLRKAFEKKVPWGQYEGWTLDQVPDKEIAYLASNAKMADLKAAARKIRQYREDSGDWNEKSREPRGEGPGA